VRTKFWSNLRTQWLTLLLIFILLWVQSLGAIHAIEHWFHDADSSCNVFFAAERLGHGLLGVLPCLAPPRYFFPVFVVHRATIFTVIVLSFRARAPPAQA